MTPRVRQVRAVFFDAAGTLFGPKEPIGRSYTRIAERFGVRADEQAVAAGFRRAFTSTAGLAFGPKRSAAELRALERRWWRALVARVFEDLGPFDDFDAYFEALFAFFADPANWIADPEAPAALHRLKERGLVVGVISNFDYRLYGILEGLGLRACFDSITISSEAGFSKPSAKLFETALARHTTRATESIHVGDSQALDVDGAAAAGMFAVLLDRDCERPVVMRERSATVGSLAYVLEVAQRLAVT